MGRRLVVRHQHERARWRPDVLIGVGSATRGPARASSTSAPWPRPAGRPCSSARALPGSCTGGTARSPARRRPWRPWRGGHGGYLAHEQNVTCGLRVSSRRNELAAVPVAIAIAIAQPGVKNEATWYVCRSTRDCASTYRLQMD
jgi:hypothetical protein